MHVQCVCAGMAAADKIYMARVVCDCTERPGFRTSEPRLRVSFRNQVLSLQQILILDRHSIRHISRLPCKAERYLVYWHTCYHTIPFIHRYTDGPLEVQRCMERLRATEHLLQTLHDTPEAHNMASYFREPCPVRPTYRPHIDGPDKVCYIHPRGNNPNRDCLDPAHQHWKVVGNSMMPRGSAVRNRPPVTGRPAYLDVPASALHGPIQPGQKGRAAAVTPKPMCKYHTATVYNFVDPKGAEAALEPSGPPLCKGTARLLRQAPEGITGEQMQEYVNKQKAMLDLIHDRANNGMSFDDQVRAGLVSWCQLRTTAAKPQTTPAQPPALVSLKPKRNPEELHSEQALARCMAERELADRYANMAMARVTLAQTKEREARDIVIQHEHSRKAKRVQHLTRVEGMADHAVARMRDRAPHHINTMDGTKLFSLTPSGMQDVPLTPDVRQRAEILNDQELDRARRVESFALQQYPDTPVSGLRRAFPVLPLPVRGECSRREARLQRMAERQLQPRAQDAPQPNMPPLLNVSGSDSDDPAYAYEYYAEAQRQM